MEGLSGAVVCAVRGGPHSQPTIQRAIRLAREEQRPLVFVYVVNLDFLSYTSSVGTQTLVDDMRNMGEFILLMAQAEAVKQGVTVRTVIREGALRDEIAALCRKLDADFLVMGRPSGAKEQNAFSDDDFGRFIHEIEDAAGVQVVLTGAS